MKESRNSGKNIIFAAAVLIIFLYAGISGAEVMISPKEPVINGNNYIFLTYNNSALNGTGIYINLTDQSGSLRRSCSITLNEYGYGMCKYNFSGADTAGNWSYSINGTSSGEFTVGKININLDEINNLSSIKYGQKTTFELNLSYENYFPREIDKTILNYDLGTHGPNNELLDVDGDNDTELIVPLYDTYVYIWDSIDRLLEGNLLVSGTDFRTANTADLYTSGRCVFGDFNGNLSKTMICPSRDGYLRAWRDINLSAGTAVAYTFQSQDFEDFRGDLELCDVDANGVYDQVAASAYQGRTYILNYSDSAGFTLIYNSTDNGSVNQDTRPVCADFDGDGYNEWVMTVYEAGNYFLDINHTGNKSVTRTVQATDRGDYLGGAAVDFDKDGKIELISRLITGRLQILEFNKSGTNLFEEDIPWNSDTDYTDFTYASSYIQIDDLNKNGRPDFVIAGSVNQPPVMFYEYNPSTSNWTQTIIYGTPLVPGAYAGIVEQSLHAPAYVDFDGDGIKEIMLFGRYSGNTYILKYNGETWDNIYRGWEVGAERFYSGDAIIYAATPINGWVYSKCATGDMDDDGKEEALCTPYDGNMFYYEEKDEYEENATPNIQFSISMNDGSYESLSQKYSEIKLLSTQTTLCIMDEISQGITDVVDEDNQNQGNIATLWTDNILSSEEYFMYAQTANNYATLDTSTTEDSIYSRIKLGNSYTSGKITIWNYYADGRSFDNVILKVTNDSTGSLCNWTANTTVFDNSADGPNKKYPESYAGKTIYFNPVEFSCLRESTSGSDYAGTLNNNVNRRTEIEIYETESPCSFDASLNRRQTSPLNAKENLTITVNGYDRTGYLVNITQTASIPVTYDTLPFSTRIVGGTEYYPGQEGQIVVQLKDEFNDPLSGATCSIDYYYPNATVWLGSQTSEEIPGTGIYYDSFVVPAVSGVYIVIANCSTGAFSDIDSHTFHVSEILLDINRTLNNITLIVAAINSTITNQLLTYILEINETTQNSLRNITLNVLPAFDELNITANELLSKWEQYNASQIYSKINETYSLVKETNSSIGEILGKWGSRTAEEIFLAINETYNLTAQVQAGMATKENISDILQELSWLSENTATGNNISRVTELILELNSSLQSVNSLILSVNSSMQEDLESIKANLTWIVYNAALQNSIDDLQENITWLLNNAANQSNQGEIISRLESISNTVSVINNATLSLNSTLSSMNSSISSLNTSIALVNISIAEAINRIQENVTWLAQNMPLNSEISSILLSLEEINSSVSNIEYSLISQIISGVEQLNYTLSSINSSLQYNFEEINANLSYIQTNMAIQMNITSVLENLSWIITNTATQNNTSAMLNGISELNSTLNNAISSINSLNGSISVMGTEISDNLLQINSSLEWLSSNTALRNNISEIINEIIWLKNNLAGKEDISNITSILENIDSGISAISPQIISINSSIQESIENVKTNLSSIISNYASSQNISGIEEDISWLISNTATSENLSGIYSRLTQLNSSINILEEGIQSLNYSLSAEFEQINSSLEWISLNMVLKENITGLQEDINTIMGFVNSTGQGETGSILTSINQSINYIMNLVSELNSSTYLQLAEISQNVSIIRNDYATKSNISEILEAINSITFNLSTTQNLSDISSGIYYLNSSINAISANINSMNSSTSSQLNSINWSLTGIIQQINEGNQNTSSVLNNLIQMNSSLSEINSLITNNIASQLNSINSTANTINSILNENITGVLQSVNSTLLQMNSYIQDNITQSLNYINNSVVNMGSQINSEVLTRLDNISSGISNISTAIDENLISGITNITSDLSALSSYLENNISLSIQETGTLISSLNATINSTISSSTLYLNSSLESIDLFLRMQIYSDINQTRQSINQALTLIGNASDNSSATTLFGEHAYTQQTIQSISSNLTGIRAMINELNETSRSINESIILIQSDINNLKEMHQCDSINTTICVYLNSIQNETAAIYYAVLNLTNGTQASGVLFSITSLAAGSPRYANEEVLLEAAFAGQYGEAIEPGSINLTIYDPNGNIWTYADKGNFSQIGNIWQYTKSISSNPTTGMYTAHLSGEYSGVENSRIAQFRIATGGPYKLILDCPSSAKKGNDLLCTVIIQDEGEAGTESITSVWLDTNSDGIADSDEPKMSFSKKTAPLDIITQPITITIPSTHPEGLYIIQSETEYVNSAQPNSKASDAVLISGDQTSGGGSGGSTTKYVYILPDDEKDISPEKDENTTDNSEKTKENNTPYPELIICNPPYIRKGNECCLDKNNNSICETDEQGFNTLTEMKENTADQQSSKSKTGETYNQLLSNPLFLPLIMLAIVLIAFLIVFLELPNYIIRLKKAILSPGDKGEEQQAKIQATQRTIEPEKEKNNSPKENKNYEPNTPTSETAAEKENEEEHTEKIAEGEQRFFLKNGEAISSLRELRDRLSTMDEDTFNYHVSKDKNDFSSWIKEILLEPGLSEEIMHSADSKEMAETIDLHIRHRV